MELKLKIYVVNASGDKFLGIGVLWLLQQIAEAGSIRQASAELGISYTKALRMLRVLEESLGRPVVIRRRGGDHRDGAVLTEFGRRVIDEYRQFQTRVKGLAQEQFADFSRRITEAGREEETEHER
jgi:molybdate transport system regulatory protein